MPTLNPTAAANHAEKANLYIAAKAFRTAHECRSVFSDNLTGGGYIPVEVSLENMGRAPLILYRQNFELTTSHGEILSATAPDAAAEHFSNSIVGGALLTGVFGVARRRNMRTTSGMPHSRARVSTRPSRLLMAKL
jgi:hypothetical protein